MKLCITKLTERNEAEKRRLEEEHKASVARLAQKHEATQKSTAAKHWANLLSLHSKSKEKVKTARDRMERMALHKYQDTLQKWR